MASRLPLGAKCAIKLVQLPPEVIRALNVLFDLTNKRLRLPSHQGLRKVMRLANRNNAPLQHHFAIIAVMIA